MSREAGFRVFGGEKTLLPHSALLTLFNSRDIEGHLFRTSGRKGLKGRKGRFDSSTARDDASGLYSEMKSSLKSGRPLRPDVLNHVPSVPQISPTREALALALTTAH